MMSDCVEIGYLDIFDPNHDYCFLPNQNWEDIVKSHHCIPIFSDMFNEWCKIFEGRVYYGSLSRPGTVPDWCGITLIPPGTIPELIRVIHQTDPAIMQGEPIEELLTLLEWVHSVQKYVICYGI